MNDFPKDPYATNAIVLITDGIENCEGDPCATGLELQKRRISLKPFIIGLGISEKQKANFDCVGTFFDAQTEQTFKNALNIVVSQALNTTSVQINLLNQYGQAKETNVELSLYDAYSGEIRYNFVHTLSKDGQPDTVFLDPVGKYNLTVHSFPSREKKNIELVPGKHNIIGIDVPQGSLKINLEKLMNYKSVQTIVKRSGKKKTLFVHDINREKKILVGRYDIEILTIPRIKRQVEIKQSKVEEIIVPTPGNLYIYSTDEGIGSIYKTEKGRYVKIYEFNSIKAREIISIQPGTYVFVYRIKKAYNTESSQEQEFTIISSKTTTLNF